MNLTKLFRWLSLYVAILGLATGTFFVSDLFLNIETRKCYAISIFVFAVLFFTVVVARTSSRIVCEWVFLITFFGCLLVFASAYYFDSTDWSQIGLIVFGTGTITSVVVFVLSVLPVWHKIFCWLDGKDRNKPSL